MYGKFMSSPTFSQKVNPMLDHVYTANEQYKIAVDLQTIEKQIKKQRLIVAILLIENKTIHAFDLRIKLETELNNLQFLIGQRLVKARAIKSRSMDKNSNNISYFPVANRENLA